MVATKLQKSSRRNQKKHRAAHQQASSKDSRRKKMKRENHCEIQGSSLGENKLTHQSDALPSCIDKLREELSCLICSEICYEPMSTWCGHSFCRKCMKIAPIKYHKKCPKCGLFIGKVRNYRVNTVIWNTIRLLFPQEVEVRKVAKSTG